MTESLTRMAPPPLAVAHERTIEDVLAQAEKIVQAMRQAMEEGIHFGRIGGADWGGEERHRAREERGEGQHADGSKHGIFSLASGGMRIRAYNVRGGALSPIPSPMYSGERAG